MNSNLIEDPACWSCGTAGVYAHDTSLFHTKKLLWQLLQDFIYSRCQSFPVFCTYIRALSRCEFPKCRTSGKDENVITGLSRVSEICIGLV